MHGKHSVQVVRDEQPHEIATVTLVAVVVHEAQDQNH